MLHAVSNLEISASTRPSWRRDLRDLISVARELRSYDRDRLGYIGHRINRDGPVFAIDDSDIVVADGRAAKKILAHTHHTNEVNVELYRPDDRVAESIAYTQHWMPAREASMSHFRRTEVAIHPRRVASTLSDISDPTTDAEVDIPTFFKRISGLVMADLIFGPEYRDELVERVAQSVSANLPVMNRSFLAPQSLPLPSIRRQKALSGALRQRLLEIIEAERESRTSTPTQRDGTLLHNLLHSHKEIPSERLRDLLQVSLLASFGVPGLCVSWTLAKIISNPSLLAAVRAEAAEQPWTTPRLLEFAPVTTAAVHESLRLYPPAWMITRVATTPMVVGDLNVAAGATLNLILFYIHRSPAWTNADAFDHTRWIAPAAAQPIYIPFGAGPRVCLGAQLGLLEVVTVLLVMLSRFDVTPTRLDLTPTVHTLLTPSQFTARLTRRNVRP